MSDLERRVFATSADLDISANIDVAWDAGDSDVWLAIRCIHDAAEGELYGTQAVAVLQPDEARRLAHDLIHAAELAEESSC